MCSAKRLSIILASYNDVRIRDALESIRRFDDINVVRLVIIDGGSNEATLAAIQPYLSDGDICISEPDHGIFDALNKGLDQCTTEFIGWLGSDDIFTGQVLSSDVMAALECSDIFVSNLAVFRGDRVRRITHALPSRLGLVKYGLHNPHYATFGRTNLFKSERFNTSLLGSDIEYFLKIFSKTERVTTTSKVSVLMREGGFSSESRVKTVRIQLQLLRAYAAETNWFGAAVALIVKFFYKSLSSLYYQLVPTPISKFSIYT